VLDLNTTENKLRELALFAGAGGGILGGKLLGWRTVCAVEIDPYCRQVLLARQRDGMLEPFPIWDDVCTFDGKQWRGQVDVVSGGFPCQDISAAGKGAGIDGERSGLWVEFARIIREVRPRFAFVENSPMLTSRGLGRVLGDLAEMGFDVEWGVLGADSLGLQHRRHRIWILADTDSNNQQRRSGIVQMGWKRCESQAEAARKLIRPKWRVKPGVPIVAYGVANRVEQLGAIGNGQVPCVAASAWNLLRSNPHYTNR
jgi:DNA (cytosine-5)-methyltransferase 1